MLLIENEQINKSSFHMRARNQELGGNVCWIKCGEWYMYAIASRGRGRKRKKRNIGSWRQFPSWSSSIFGFHNHHHHLHPNSHQHRHQHHRVEDGLSCLIINISIHHQQQTGRPPYVDHQTPFQNTECFKIQKYKIQNTKCKIQNTT